MFKEIGFAIDIETNLEIRLFSDIAFNLNNGTHRPFKKPNDFLSYANKSSNDSQQIFSQLPKSN